MDRLLSPYIVIFVGAGIGGVLRHVLNNAIPKAVGTAYPFATPFINITGSLAMGLLVGWLAFKDGEDWTQSLRLFVATGILGGYTTFSTGFSPAPCCPSAMRRTRQGSREHQGPPLRAG